MRFPLSLLSLGCLCASVVSAQAVTADEVITKARARVGTEAALKAVKSLSFEATYIEADGKKSYFQKDYKAPCKRREYRLFGDYSTERISAYNGLEGFEKTVQPNRQQGLRSFSPEEKNLYADLYELDMGFFAAPPRGSVTYSGEQYLKDLAKYTYTLDYKFAGGLHAKRYFDRSTYALLRQEIYREGTAEDKRLVQTDEGEIIVDGIRFPQKSTQAADGKKTV
ncbi:MAG: hypothetical protein LBT53_02505, partial [Puniceicoccales bacterium]|nr:hypothetical protein [Puniceicoccales bacterium]